MAGIFQAIGDFFGMIAAIISLVLNLIFSLFFYVFKGIEVLTRLCGVFPFISLPLIAIVIICVVYKILGREASS